MDAGEPLKKEKEKKGHHHKKEKGTKSSKKRHAKEATAIAPKEAVSGGSAAAYPDEDEAANKVRVEALCATPPNNICADCREHGTRWACVNHGIFVCLRCSGIHRSLGVHVSKVKSTNMDGWSTAEVDVMEAIGNARAASLFEAHVPATFAGISARSTDHELRTFIEKKYNQKEFAMEHVGDILRRVYKKAGYGPYAGRATKTKEKTAAVQEGEAAGAETAAAKHADPRDTLKALYGRDTVTKETKKTETKKSKKEIPVYGTFGLVNVPSDDYKEHLAKLLELFGVPPEEGEEVEKAEESAPVAAAAPPQEVAEGEAGDAIITTAA